MYKGAGIFYEREFKITFTLRIEQETFQNLREEIYYNEKRENDKSGKEVCNLLLVLAKECFALTGQAWRDRYITNWRMRMNLHDCKILLVDDEKALREMAGGFLRRAGFHKVTVAASCREAEELFMLKEPHLVLLDVMLPDGDGFSLFKKLRQMSEVPVIFLSARDEDENRLRGLGLGADDYITKPFLPEELILRVTAVLKRVYRVKSMQEEEIIALGGCQVDLGSGVVRWNKSGAEVTLTAKEYAILQKLAQERGRIVTIDALCDAVWQEENYGYENTLVVHIRRLREKMEEDPSHPKYLLTVRGLGYRLV